MTRRDNFVFIAVWVLVALMMWARGYSAGRPDCVEDEYYHVQSGRCVHIEEIQECGPDRCQTAQEACSAVRRLAEEYTVEGRSAVAQEFVEAACGY